MLDLFAHLSSHTVVAASAITWTPTTFYVAMGILHTILILAGFRLMQVDAEHNSFIGAILAAGVFNAIAFFTKDVGVVGILISGAAIFGLLVAVSSGEALKALGMTLLVIAMYGVVGQFIVSRTPLTIDDLAGFPRMVATGGLEPEPITEEDHKRLERSGVIDEE